ncbi:MAG: hypothetical protein HKUEN07_03760 [Rhodocyclaceae bacterium]|uniref:Uncharacterized protein n=1 Tax=Candidatus Desulfobacillus denitrificans TaxID=2608985 RepID=A0A809SAF7_9PROT|nr:conserved hypothetical protein [Candidatus Desulfobacillus denitrificans]GIK46177.1 MAG: hypothetical protein BroJett012_20800 [Betaproteobacteria bacterium]GJQ53807.1 MAG: hypothetical protein HKUEN07_03760 [Rhodocyclaceae bacterium]
MATLAAWLASLVSAAFGFLSAQIGAKAALYVAVAAVSLTITAALYATIQGLVAGLVSTVTNEAFRMAFYSIWPSNATTCISACLGADVAVFIYRYKVGIVEAMAK